MKTKQQEQQVEELPTAGGSYIRNEDGGLVQQEGTEPAVNRASPDPEVQPEEQ